MPPRFEKPQPPPSPPRPTRTTRSTAPPKEAPKSLPEYHTYTLNTLVELAEARKFSFPLQNLRTMKKAELILTHLQQDHFDHNRHLAALSVLPVHKLNGINDEFGSERQSRMMEDMTFKRWMAKQKYEVAFAEYKKRNEMLMPDEDAMPDEKAHLAQLREQLRDDRDEIILNHEKAIAGLDREEKEKRNELEAMKEAEKEERGREAVREREKEKRSRIRREERKQREEERKQKEAEEKENVGQKKRLENLAAQDESETDDLDNLQAGNNPNPDDIHAWKRKQARDAARKHEKLTVENLLSVEEEDQQQSVLETQAPQQAPTQRRTNTRELKRRRSYRLFDQEQTLHQQPNSKQTPEESSTGGYSDHDQLPNRNASKRGNNSTSPAEISYDEEDDSWKATAEENAAWDARGGMRQYNLPGPEKDALAIANLVFLMDREKYLELAGMEEDDDEDLV
ncbi:hypothetical protein B0J14DRAFT_672619 [Halenospora varia]|nr:hypothetical protein B0J14DRAFT_672619 [Halenospora varia]